MFILFLQSFYQNLIDIEISQIQKLHPLNLENFYELWHDNSKKQTIAMEWKLVIKTFLRDFLRKKRPRKYNENTSEKT